MPSREVTVVDYGVGNLLSVQRALEVCGAAVTVTSDADAVARASHLLVPGVGAFANGMQALEREQLVEPIQEAARRGSSVFGICLGMQLLFDESEEFRLTPGLGLIPGRVVAIPSETADGAPQKVPHIGWNTLTAPAGAAWHDTVLEPVQQGDCVYFVHSFMAVPAHEEHRLADCRYGGQRIAAAVRRENVTGCQFHPEKSGEVGLRVLRRFVDA